MVAATPTPAHPGRVSDEREQVRHNAGWRADVVAIIASDAELLEYVRYSSYGVPTSYPKGDYDLDGDVDASDTTALGNFIAGAGGWNLDFNRDGNTDGDDTTEHAAYRTGYTGGSGGRGVQSRSALRNRLGYAGYQWDDTINAYHVRHRVYMPEIGRWTRRDPLGYVDGMSDLQYVGGSVLRFTDSSGLYAVDCARNLFNRIQGGLTPTTNWQCRLDLISNLDACCASRDRSGGTAADYIRCIDDSVAVYESCAREHPAGPFPDPGPGSAPEPLPPNWPGEDPNLPTLPWDPRRHDCMAACEQAATLMSVECGRKYRSNPVKLANCHYKVKKAIENCYQCCGGDLAKTRRLHCAQELLQEFLKKVIPKPTLNPRGPSGAGEW